jgi:hypothetical protein
LLFLKRRPGGERGADHDWVNGGPMKPTLRRFDAAYSAGCGAAFGVRLRSVRSAIQRHTT